MEIDITRGDYSVLQYTALEVYDADGNPRSDLNGLTWLFTARKRPNDTNVVFQKSSASGQITVSGMVVKVKIEGSDTSSLTGGEVLYCDLQATDAQGRNYTVKLKDSEKKQAETPYLKLRVLPDVTR